MKWTTKDEVHGYANDWLSSALKLEYEGTKCNASTVMQVLLIAAARVASVFAVCRDLADAPCDQTIRNALARALPEITELERRLNRSLVTQLPKALFRKSRRIAIDLTLIPYYGQPYADEKEIDRSAPKSGTTHFYAYATAAVVHKGHRDTLALTPVEYGEKMKEVVQRLMAIALVVAICSHNRTPQSTQRWDADRRHQIARKQDQFTFSFVEDRNCDTNVLEVVMAICKDSNDDGLMQFDMGVAALTGSARISRSEAQDSVDSESPIHPSNSAEGTASRNSHGRRFSSSSLNHQTMTFLLGCRPISCLQHSSSISESLIATVNRQVVLNEDVWISLIHN